MRLAYRHAYLRTVKSTFTQWVQYSSQSHPTPNEVENGEIPEEPLSKLSPEAKKLAAKAMLGRALAKLQRYTAHRAVRAEEYRLARRQWYMFRLKVSFRKIVANVDDEKKTRLKVQQSTSQNAHEKNMSSRVVRHVRSKYRSHQTAKKSHEERFKRNAIVCLGRMRQNTLLRLRRATKSLCRMKLKRQFGAWASVVAIASTYRQLMASPSAISNLP